MKIYSMFHRFVFLMAVLIFSMPLVTLAQENLVPAKIVAAAEAHAETDINKTAWFVTGCFGSVFGLIYATAAEPVVPATRLLGKSPGYVEFYTVAYTDKAKEIQKGHAALGCIISGCIVGAIVHAAGNAVGETDGLADEATEGCCLAGSEFFNF